MKYAIIDLKGCQFRVAEGEEIEIDHLLGEKDSQLKIDQVLMVADGDRVEVGTPTVENASVTVKILDQFKGKKIRVATYKAKSRYRRVKGFRPQLTRIKIEKIDFSVKQKKAKKATKEVRAKKS